jgi:phytoene dehydrogenase-like protein
MNGHYAVTALQLVPIREWSRWSGSRLNDRPEDYRITKEEFAARLESKVEAMWPDAAEHCSRTVAFTPLTFESYTRTPGGTAYGVCRSTDQALAASFNPRTRISGLLQVGQSIFMPGVLGAIASGVNAAATVFGPEYLIDRIRRETS